MKTADVLQGQYQAAHGFLQQVMAGCPASVLNQQVPNATIGSIAAVYAHAIFSEDGIVSGMLQAKPPVYVSGGWAAKASVAMPEAGRQTPEWAATVAMDAKAFGEYAAAVTAATQAYVGSLSDADLERVVETGFMGKQSVAAILGNLALWHMISHQGEIAALLGVQGQKGLPF